MLTQQCPQGGRSQKKLSFHPQPLLSRREIFPWIPIWAHWLELGPMHTQEPIIVKKKMGLLGLLWINCNSIPEASYYPDKRRLYCLLNEWRTTTNRKGYTYPSNMPIIALWQFNSLTREMQSSIIKSKYKRLTKY